MYYWSTNKEVSQIDLQEKLRAYVLHALTLLMVGTANGGIKPLVSYNKLYQKVLRSATLENSSGEKLDMSINDIMQLYGNVFLWCYNRLLPQALDSVVKKVKRSVYVEEIREQFETWIIHSEEEEADPTITDSVYQNIYARINHKYCAEVHRALIAAGASQTQRDRVLAKLKL